MKQLSIFDETPKETKEDAMFEVDGLIGRYEPKIEELKKAEGTLEPDSLEAMAIEIWESFKGAMVIIESDPVKEIRCTVEFLMGARLEEARRGYAVSEKRASLARKKGNIKARSTSVVSKAYADDLITGKNESIRKGQEHQIVAEDELIASYENEASTIRSEIVDLQVEYDTSAITRRYFEELLSAQRAVLLFLSRTENL